MISQLSCFIFDRLGILVVGGGSSDTEGLRRFRIWYLAAECNYIYGG